MPRLRSIYSMLMTDRRSMDTIAPKIDPAAVGKRVSALRDQKRWTQDDLAKRTSMSKSFLSEIENGHTLPGGDRLLRLAEAFGSTTDYLLRGAATHAPSAPKSVTVPPDLAALAREKGWSFDVTEKLIQTYESIVARRSRAGERDWGASEWEKLHERLKEYLGE